jgi:hypothetical protein
MGLDLTKFRNMDYYFGTEGVQWVSPTLKVLKKNPDSAFTSYSSWSNSDGDTDWYEGTYNLI